MQDALGLLEKSTKILNLAKEEMMNKNALELEFGDDILQVFAISSHTVFYQWLGRAERDA